jgi:hypothetical protein
MRKLSLKKETVAELTADELDQVAGGSGLSCNVLCAPPSDFMECITGLNCLSFGAC